MPIADLDPGLRGCNPIPRIQFCTLPSSFPRKREPRDFSHLPLGPRFRGDDEVVCPWDLPTASFAGKTKDERRVIWVERKLGLCTSGWIYITTTGPGGVLWPSWAPRRWGRSGAKLSGDRVKSHDADAFMG